MSLNYEFAPIDVNIMTHPKACAAGPEAMGLWLWGQTYAKLHETDGRIHRMAALTAWGGKRNIMLAKRLVEAGLWLSREDGDWDVHNFERKSPGRKTPSGAPPMSSTERVRKLRAERKAAESTTKVRCETDVTETETAETRFSNAGTSTSISTSVSVSSSGESPRGGERRFEPGTASAVEALEAYEGAVRDATGANYVLPRAPFHGQDLCRLMNTHAPPGSTRGALAWLGIAIAQWVSVTDQRFSGGWVPSKFLAWLNAGKPDGRERSKGAEITKQPFDPNAPWMKLGDTGS